MANAGNTGFVHIVRRRFWVNSGMFYTINNPNSTDFGVNEYLDKTSSGIRTGFAAECRLVSFESSTKFWKGFPTKIGQRLLQNTFWIGLVLL